MGSFPEAYDDPLRHIKGFTVFATRYRRKHQFSLTHTKRKNSGKNVILPFLQQVPMAAVRTLASK